MKKKLLIFMALFLLALGLSGCNDNKKSVAQEANTTDTWSHIRNVDVSLLV
jgi:Entericidin EcnA/B family.